MSAAVSVPAAKVPAHGSVAGIRRLLAADFARVLRQTTGGKPTSRFRRMMHLTLPAMQVATLHRVAHMLHGHGWRRCAALVADLSLRVTGASIHPGSRIGPGLFVPHLGDGVVVGAHAAVQGAVAIGAGATVGVGVCTLRDVPAGTVTMLAQRQVRSVRAIPEAGHAV
jgi:serine O-acetyltransferase